MKRLLIVMFSITAMIANAQTAEKWKICFNKQVLYSGNAEQTETVIVVDAGLLKKDPNGVITISYVQPTPNKNWKRTFYINDEADQLVHSVELKTQIGKVSFSALPIKQMANAKKPVFIYTTSIPKNPEKAAVVRVRRILLCRIDWK